MAQITQRGTEAIEAIATRNQVSKPAVMTLLHALQSGHGTAAQFDCAELGGMGQWSKGGMIQVGDMFNDNLKQKVNAICAELADLISDRTIFSEANEGKAHNPSGSEPPENAGSAGSRADAGHWWPGDLGMPASTGGQNDMQYALFPGRRRLAIRQGDAVTIYDSGDHEIGGFSQAQGSGRQDLTFSSQHGKISTADLRKVG